MKQIFIKRQTCLFINIGSISEKLLQSSKISQNFRVINYDTLSHKRSITSVVDKLNIKIIVMETTNVKGYKENEIAELVSLRTRGVVIHDAENFYEIVCERVPIVKLNKRTYLGDRIFSIQMRKRYRYLKRLFDLLCVFAITPFALPLIFLGVLLTKLTSKGDAFFSQVRVGEYGKNFTIRKIRTMEEKGNHGGFTQSNDARVTCIGRILRLTKIDELPQLWNILIGEMSLIGPRPERPEYVEQYAEINPFFKLRHMIKPGVSGWAQIHFPKATPEDNLKKLEYDLYYIKNYRWPIDIKIIWETIKIVLRMDSN